MIEVYTLGPDQQPRQFTVFGVAPDDVTAAVIMAGDQQRILPVSQNYYHGEAPVPLRLIELRSQLNSPRTAP
jgi:hypothetical protein